MKPGLPLAAIVLGFAASPLASQVPDAGAAVDGALAEATGGRLRLTFEFRNRFESRTGNAFGRDPDLLNLVLRTRVGAQYRATRWLKFTTVVQDCRAPLYGSPAPPGVRDATDLHEAYMELRPGADTGWGALVGRQVVNLGEGRLLGAANWGNTSRTYDGARLYWTLPAARIEFLAVSIVKVQPDRFNRSQRGDRLWGMYNTFPRWIAGGSIDAYLLRRDQTRAGGFSAPGSLAVNH